LKSFFFSKSQRLINLPLSNSTMDTFPGSRDSLSSKPTTEILVVQTSFLSWKESGLFRYDPDSVAVDEEGVPVAQAQRMTGAEGLMDFGSASSKACQFHATRADKRIGETRERVRELVKLDPTNPRGMVSPLVFSVYAAAGMYVLIILEGAAAGYDTIRGCGLDFSFKFAASPGAVGDIWRVVSGCASRC